MNLFHEAVFAATGASKLDFKSGKGSIRFKLKWKRARESLVAAREAGERMAVLIGDASTDTQRIVAWALVDDIVVQDEATVCRYADLKRINGHRATELTKLSNGEPVGQSRQIVYVPVQTPSFIGGGRPRGASAADTGAPAYLLTWIRRRFRWEGLAAEAERTKEGDSSPYVWSCGGNKTIPRGARLFLMHLRAEPRGIVASGWALSAAPYEQEHWDPERAARGEKALFVTAEFERILDPEHDAPLSHAALRARFPDVTWFPQGSGITIPAPVAAELEKLWAKHLAQKVTDRRVTQGDPEVTAYEGHLRLGFIRHRRREQRLRRAKIAAVLSATGRLTCEVPGCGFDFERVYGAAARGFAHVHHLKPLASADTPRLTKLDDLKVVCANCHAFIHLGGQCRAVEDLLRSKRSHR